MHEVSIRSGDVESPAGKRVEPEAQLSDEERATARPVLGPAVAAGLAALLLIGPTAVVVGNGDASRPSDGSIRDQFATAFTPEVVDPGPSAVESVKLGN